MLFNEARGGFVPERGDVVIAGAVGFGHGGFRGVGEEVNLEAGAVVARD